jgi:hypothetical protein
MTQRKFNVAAVVLSLLLLFLISVPMLHDVCTAEERQKLFTQVKRIADVIDDDILTDKEWKSVYESLGKTYHPIHSEPWVDLSLGDMRRYIECKKQNDATVN